MDNVSRLPSESPLVNWKIRTFMERYEGAIAWGVAAAGGVEVMNDLPDYVKAEIRRSVDLWTTNGFNDLWGGGKPPRGQAEPFTIDRRGVSIGQGAAVGRFADKFKQALSVAENRVGGPGNMKVLPGKARHLLRRLTREYNKKALNWLWSDRSIGFGAYPEH